MEERTYASRKSRLVYYGAQRGVSEWRTVGTITIFSSELSRPLILEGQQAFVVFQERQNEGDLRSAAIHLHRLKRPDWDRWFLIAVSFLVGMAITRAWFVWHYALG